jgi:hypothetical protein
LHEDYVKGVVLEFMNLKYPSIHTNAEGKKLNSALYMASWPGKATNPPKWTAGDLFRILGDAVQAVNAGQETERDKGVCYGRKGKPLGNALCRSE